MTGLIHEPALIGSSVEPEAKPKPKRDDPVLAALRSARFLIERGWTHGTRTEWSQSTHWFPDDRGGGRYGLIPRVNYCALGAIDASAPNRRVVRAARSALRRAAGVRSISLWNDRSGQSDVLRGFDRAIARLEGRLR